MFYLLVSVFLCADNTFISGHQSGWREEEEEEEVTSVSH